MTQKVLQGPLEFLDPRRIPGHIKESWNELGNDLEKAKQFYNDPKGYLSERLNVIQEGFNELMDTPEGHGQIAGAVLQGVVAKKVQGKFAKPVRVNPPVLKGHTRVYRAVSEAEFQDILASGRLRQGPNSLEGKWFADSIEGAKAHGKNLYPDGKFRLIEVDIPDNAPSLFKHSDLDGFGPARYLDNADLSDLVPRPLE